MDTMMYGSTVRLQELYGLLQDERSRAVFWARLRADIDPVTQNVADLAYLCSAITPEIRQKVAGCKDKLERLAKIRHKIVIYGTANTGRRAARELERAGIPVYGFCGRHAANYADGLMGKPVLSPDELFAGPERYFVLVAAAGSSLAEIEDLLREKHFPEDRIMSYGCGDVHFFDPDQYFGSPSLYQKGTAFIDGGCYDSSNSVHFAKWCDGQYSKIIAFEPDPQNCAKCIQVADENHLRDFELIPAGLAEKAKTVRFLLNGSASSRIADLAEDRIAAEQIQEVRSVAIDEVVGDLTIGFIKMDIEGAEYEALHGAVRTITRDRPLLAICVYHQAGDVLAIMDYLHKIVPEYRFWLRQHMAGPYETVLYAAVNCSAPQVCQS